MSDINEKAVAVLEKEYNPALAAVEKFKKIKSPEDMEKAGTLLTQLNKYNDGLEKEKKNATDGLNKSLKVIRGWFKPRQEKVEEAIDILRKSMGAYQLAAEKKADEKRDKLAQQVESGEISPEKAVAKMDRINEPAANIEVAGGSVKFRDQKKFEVMDLTMLPIEYHIADEAAIRKAMQEGTELPGVKYWIEKVPVNSR